MSRIETELLLLNIARQRHYHPIHFTAVSSIAATFNFTVNAGVIGLTDDRGTGANATISLGGSASENPTITIIPIQGQEFTERLLTPMHQSKAAFFAHQGVDLAIILRLMARGIVLSGYDESGFLLNEPHQIEGYSEFRRRILHLSALREQRQLWIQRLANHENRAQHIEGPILMTNYDPARLQIEEQKALQQEAGALSQNSILIDIRPGSPGGDYPLRGSIQLRSFKGLSGSQWVLFCTPS